MTNYVGLGDLAVFMGVAQSSLSAALADLALAAAQDAVRKYIDQVITLVTNDVAYIDGYGKPWLRLPERPVRSVALVEEGDATGGGTFETVPAADYRLRRSLLFRTDGAVWIPGNVNYRVTYTHGYDVGEIDSDSDSDFDALHVPAYISLVTLNAARRIYDGLGSSDGFGNAENIKQETIGSYSYTLSSSAEQLGAAAGVELLSAEKAILDRYNVKGAG